VKEPKNATKKQQKWQAKTLSEMFANIRRGQEYVTVVMQRDSWESLAYAIKVAFREEEKHMATKEKIVAPAVKDKKTGVIMEAPSKKWAHDQIEAKEHIKDKNAKRGFVTSEDKFVKRKKAAKIAKEAGQIKDKDIKRLHSSDLRRAGGLAKKKIK
jgi:dihydrofolate reductase